jgi:hypothetical protein
MRAAFIGYSARVRGYGRKAPHGFASLVDRERVDASPERARDALRGLAGRQSAAPCSGEGRSRQDRPLMTDRRSRCRWWCSNEDAAALLRPTELSSNELDESRTANDPCGGAGTVRA